MRLSTSLVRYGTIDVTRIREKLAHLDPGMWSDGVRNRFQSHQMARHLFLMNDVDGRHYNGSVYPSFWHFIEDIEPLIDHARNVLNGSGHLIRLQFAALEARGTVPPHTDTSVSLICSHRLHVPIVTNDQCEFVCGGVSVHMKAGEVWDFDNTRTHAVFNRGPSTRIHLILDWAGSIPTALWPRYLRQRAERVLRGDIRLNRRLIREGIEAARRCGGLAPAASTVALAAAPSD